MSVTSNGDDGGGHHLLGVLGHRVAAELGGGKFKRAPELRDVAQGNDDHALAGTEFLTAFVCSSPHKPFRKTQEKGRPESAQLNW